MHLLPTSMTTELEYQPDLGIKLNSKTINWKTNRDDVRKLIGLPFKEFDRVVELGADKSILSRRDIYENINGGKNYFFFIYNADNVLNEIEIHWGIDIYVKGVKLIFEKDIKENVKALATISDNFMEIEPGNYLFPDLKLTIADKDSFGGEGHDLGYFYASTDIKHLEE